MTFTIGPPTVDGRQRVYATGSIDSGTADNFQRFIAAHGLSAGTVIAFHSPGGNTADGLEIGTVIRQHAFDTEVAQPASGASGLLARITSDKPGVCASSCSFAFLGGVTRAVPSGSLYGVHDAYMEKSQSGDDLLDLGQKIAGDITLYLNEMGVDPRLLSVLTRFNSNQGEVFFMPARLMAQLKVTTSDTTAWALRDTKWGFGLEGRNPEVSNIPGAAERMIFSCTGNPRHIVLGAFYVPEAALADAGHVTRTSPAFFAQTVTGYALTIVRGGNAPIAQRFVTITIPSNDIATPARVADSNDVVAFVTLTPQMTAALRDAEILTFQFKQLIGSGGVTVDFSGGRDQAMQLINNCR